MSDTMQNPADSVEAWLRSVQSEIEQRRVWWEERGIRLGVREKGWTLSRKLLPDDITAEELAGIEPALGWAQERLEQCVRCTSAGGECDVEFSMSVEKGKLPIWNSEKRDVEFRWCAQHVEHLLRKRLAYFGVPRVLLGASLDNFDGHSELVLGLRGYVNAFDRTKQSGYHFVGEQGTGKSHLAAAVLRELTKRQLVSSAYYAFVPSLLEDIRAAMNDSDAYSELRRRLLSCDFLVLDDLGAERGTDWVREQLGIIMHERWSNARPVLVTSNHPLDRYAKFLGKRTYSRLRALTPYVRVLSGKDRRLT